MMILSPSPKTASVTLCPLTSVPLVEPRSVILATISPELLSTSTLIRACSRDALESFKRTSASNARPRITSFRSRGIGVPISSPLSDTKTGRRSARERSAIFESLCNWVLANSFLLLLLVIDSVDKQKLGFLNYHQYDVRIVQQTSRCA